MRRLSQTAHVAPWAMSGTESFIPVFGERMRGRKSPYVVSLAEDERNELNRWIRTPSMPSGLVRRARAVLLVSEGKSLSEAGRMVGMGRRIVRLRVCRFNDKRIEGLRDKPGRGVSPFFPCEVALHLVKIACEMPDQLGSPSPFGTAENSLTSSKKTASFKAYQRKP